MIKIFLHLKNIEKSFRTNNESEVVLSDINLQINKGEFVSILGPSGCGKSTLLSIVAGLIKPSSGTIFLEGKKITKPGKDRGVVFQSASLFPWLSVEENIMFPLKKEMNKSNAREIATKHLQLVHLSKYRNYYPHELSGGMQQRVAIARALAMDPQVLLMDEPFGALDEQTRLRLHEQLESIWLTTGKTILFITHSIQEALRLSDRVIVMGTKPGIILADLHLKVKRPRINHAHELISAEQKIMALLKGEIDKIADEEYRYASSH